jgi:hypothetical protein
MSIEKLMNSLQRRGNLRGCSSIVRHKGDEQKGKKNKKYKWDDVGEALNMTCE